MLEIVPDVALVLVQERTALCPAVIELGMTASIQVGTGRGITVIVFEQVTEPPEPVAYSVKVLVCRGCIVLLPLSATLPIGLIRTDVA